MEAITKYDHKTRTIQTRVLYTNFSSTFSCSKFLRPYLRNALNFLLKQASERASCTLHTFFPPSLIRTRTHFMFQPRGPPFYTSPPRLRWSLTAMWAVLQWVLDYPNPDYPYPDFWTSAHVAFFRYQREKDIVVTGVCYRRKQSCCTNDFPKCYKAFFTKYGI